MGRHRLRHRRRPVSYFDGPGQSRLFPPRKHRPQAAVCLDLPALATRSCEPAVLAEQPAGQGLVRVGVHPLSSATAGSRSEGVTRAPAGPPHYVQPFSLTARPARESARTASAVVTCAASPHGPCGLRSLFSTGQRPARHGARPAWPQGPPGRDGGGFRSKKLPLPPTLGSLRRRESRLFPHENTVRKLPFAYGPAALAPGSRQPAVLAEEPGPAWPQAPPGVREAGFGPKNCHFRALWGHFGA
jgi:hypothetical protein